MSRITSGPSMPKVVALIKQIADKCGVVLPEGGGYFRASLVLDAQSGVRLIVEVPVTDAAIESCLEKSG